MHGCRAFVSRCETVVYTLNCENVHSSASDIGNTGFIGRCLTSKKYLDVCWDFKMSLQLNRVQILGERSFQVWVTNVHSTNWDPQSPAVSLYSRRGWKQAWKKQLNSAFLISSKRSPFGFMFMTSDLTDRVDEDVKSSGLSFSDISAWEWPRLVSSCVLWTSQFSKATQMVSKSVIILGFFSLLLDNPPAVPVI